MSKWKMVRLGDIGVFRTGGTPSRNSPEFFNGIHPWITTVALGSTYIDSSNANEFLTDDAVKNSATKIVPANSLMIGIRVGIGKTSINLIPMCTNQDIVSISEIDIRTISIKYLKKYLDTKKNYFNSQKRGATIQGVKTDLIKELVVPLPPLDVQQKIADVLDKASGLIELRCAQLDKLDLLIKSQFIEMFGYPQMNSKRFREDIGKNLFVFSSGKFLEEAKRKTEGIPVYGGNGIAWYTDKPLISHSTIVIGRVGAYCGNVRIISEPVWITDNAIYIKEFKQKCFSLFFLYYFTESLKFSQYADFSGQPKITQKPLENQRYMIPPLELQKQFAAFVEQVENQKKHIQQSLSQLELNYKSLMQKCFRGEIF